MRCKSSIKNTGTILSIISFIIPLIVFIFMLNWFFGITQYQKLQGIPLMISPLVCPIGILCGFVSMKIKPNKLGKWSIIFNAILITLPFLYWVLGTLVFGP